MQNLYLRRRSFFKMFSLSMFCAFNTGFPLAGKESAKELTVYIGTYTNGGSEGIYIYSLDLSSGNLKYISAAKSADPSYLTLHPNKKFLYAVNELKEYNGKPGGAVSAFSINPKTGGLTLINQQPSCGVYPCYLGLDKSGKYVYVANYGSGNLAVLPVLKDGSLGEPSDTIQHFGKGINSENQEGPHAHCIDSDPDGNFILAADLGIDKLMIYKPDYKTDGLVSNQTPWIKIRDGAGPRHFCFHPNGKFLFLINELNSTMVSFAYDAQNGVLKEIQTVSTLPGDYSGHNSCADIHVSPDGRFVYGSNRGHDSIVIFAIDNKTGKLDLIGFEPTMGRTPRNFAIDPTGSYLLAANQNSNNIVVFKIDNSSGKPEPTGVSVNIPNPVCVKFYAK
ncbi:lactonase family protein [candidate division KSB1 bacterium]|nr:lactonase family protein [candidate division KSB1 bacterium]